MIRDDAIVAALAAGLSQREAAQRAGASLRSVERRMADPAFRAWVEESRANSHDLQRVYTALDRAREAWLLVQNIPESNLYDITTQEAKRHAEMTVHFLNEWVYMLEEECAS